MGTFLVTTNEQPDFTETLKSVIDEEGANAVLWAFRDVCCENAKQTHQRGSARRWTAMAKELEEIADEFSEI